MKSIKKMTAILVLAAMATLSAPQANAGIMLGDRSGGPCRNGIMLGDRVGGICQNGITLNDMAGIVLTDAARLVIGN